MDQVQFNNTEIVIYILKVKTIVIVYKLNVRY